MQLAVVLSKRRIKRFNRNVVAVVAATTVLSAVGVAGANTGSGPVKPPQLGAHELPGNLRGESNRFASLEAAVASGVIDAEIVAELRTNESVKAIVTVADDDILAAAEVSRSGEAGEGRAAAILASVKPAFAARKARALGRGGEDVQPLRDFDTMGASFVRIRSERALLAVANHGEVTGIRVNALGQVALEQSLAHIRQPDAAAGGHRGTGTYTVVLDTGVNYAHAAFGSCTAPNSPSTCRVASSWDAAPEDYRLDDDGHGTNVAGIVAAVAPGTKILAADVFAMNAAGDQYYETQWVLAGINWANDLKGRGYNVRAINMSLGVRNTWYTSTCASAFTTAFSTARSLGIVPIVAAGNSGANGGYGGIGTPACTAGALSVGAVYDANVGTRSWSGCTDWTTAADKVTCFSQTGPNLTVLAPGAMITAAGITQGGTSQAAPHVAGAVAVLAAASPAATVDQIQSALAGSGPAISDPRVSGVTKRRLDLPAALAMLGLGDSTAPTMRPVVEQIDVPNQITSTAVPVRFTWSASDAGGIATYELWVKTNAGEWVRDTSVTTQTQKLYSLAVGSTYTVAVRAKDAAGNWSAYSYSPPLTVGIGDEKAFTLAGGWRRYTWANTYGGTAITSSVANDSVTYAFSGRDVALVAPRFSTAGRAKVYCDGTYYGLVDLYASTLTDMNTVFWCRFAESTTHTMKLVLEGTSGRPRFDVDAFAVLS